MGRRLTNPKKDGFSLVNPLGDVFVVVLARILEVHATPQVANCYLPSAIHPALLHQFPGCVATEIRFQVRLLGIEHPEVDPRIPKQRELV